MINASKLFALIGKLPPAVISLVVDLVERIAKSPDPKAAAKRALEETAHHEAFKATMRARRKKS